MNINKILIILGEPNSIFSEILAKFLVSNKFRIIKKKIILIGNIDLFYDQTKKLGYHLNINQINCLKESKLKKINFINIKYNYKKTFEKISNKSNNYIENCFNKAIDLSKLNNDIALINGPISKKHFLKRKYLGITEYLTKKTNSKSYAMLIYNKNLSVSPITTHLPLSKVHKNIGRDKIIKKIQLINKFYKSKLKIIPNVAILGLNPHCESIQKVSEEKKIIIPSIKYLKKNRYKIEGPYSTDTFFIDKNLKKFDVVIGMYHDQVLTPIKTLYKFDAINITIGLPFIRISPDHGPNYEMIGKNISDPSSIFKAIEFINKLK